QFAELAAALGVPETASDPRFSSNPARVENRHALHELLEAQMRERPCAAWEAELRRRSIPCSRVRTVADLVADEQLGALGMLGAVPSERIPDLRLVSLPITADGIRMHQRLPPPGIGEHTDEILAELGFTPGGIARLHEKGAVS
ncbi:MAG TPA: CoA transferase, partial [Candidatus Dormibacteraeota bacterium]|nr:CoA transferase [Candidatus Dormibacteraeota bacterium]